MAELNELPAHRGGARECWVICNSLEEGRDPTAVEWIRHCERCGTGVYVKPCYVDQGYRVSCWWCHPPERLVTIHPQALTELDTAEVQDAYLALGEIREWLDERADAQRRATLPLRHRRRWRLHPSRQPRS